MLVNRPRLKTQGAVVTAVASLALGACEDPTARTDLRPEGPPDVLAVLVLNDALGGLVESAAFCKKGDEKRPGLVGLPDFTTTQICPEELATDPGELEDAAPLGWYVRIMFDELLDPDIEDLLPVLDENNQETGVFNGTIAKTKPVTLQCENFTGAMIDIPYDGYYSPSGNNVTWPLGPSLVVKPNNPELLSVGSKCQITLKDNIADKSGEKVPQDQRGPFTFKIAPVQAIATFPGDGETIDPENAGVEVVFNTDIAKPPASAVKFTPDAGGTFVVTFAANDYLFGSGLLDDTAYTFEIPEGTKLKDHCGKETTLGPPSLGAHTKVSFKTSPMELLTVTPFAGMNHQPVRKIKIDFNQSMDPASIDATEYTLTPTPPSGAPTFIVDYSGDDTIMTLDAQYAPDTEYTFTLNKGATIRDAYNTKDYVVPEAIVAKFRMAPAITLVSSSPANNATVTKATTTSIVQVTLTFNQEMDPASLVVGTDYTLVDDATGQAIAATISLSPTNPAQVRVRTNATIPAGKYTFTLKGGATLTDKITPTPNTYTQAADRVIKFTVRESTPAPKCTGAP